MRILGMVVSVLLFFGACDRKERADRSATTETTAPRSSAPSSESAPTHTPPRSESNVSANENRVRFQIRDIDRRETFIEFTESRVRFHKIRQPIVMITLFADWCPPCRGMLPYLDRLQTRNGNDLFLIGILVNSGLDDRALRDFMLRHSSSFFISNHSDNDALGGYLARRYLHETDYPLPLTLIFKNGRYVMQISGAIPYEMLQNLVDQLKEKRSDTHVRISEKSPRKDQRSDPGSGPGEKKQALQGGAGGGTP